MQDAAKTVLRMKLIALNIYVRKEDRSKCNRKEIVKIRAEAKKMGNKNRIKSINTKLFIWKDP